MELSTPLTVGSIGSQTLIHISPFENLPYEIELLIFHFLLSGHYSPSSSESSLPPVTSYLTISRRVPKAIWFYFQNYQTTVLASKIHDFLEWTLKQTQAGYPTNEKCDITVLWDIEPGQSLSFELSKQVQDQYLPLSNRAACTKCPNCDQYLQSIQSAFHVLSQIGILRKIKNIPARFDEDVAYQKILCARAGENLPYIPDVTTWAGLKSYRGPIHFIKASENITVRGALVSMTFGRLIAAGFGRTLTKFDFHGPIAPDWFYTTDILETLTTHCQNIESIRILTDDEYFQCDPLALPGFHRAERLTNLELMGLDILSNFNDILRSCYLTKLVLHNHASHPYEAFQSSLTNALKNNTEFEAIYARKFRVQDLVPELFTHILYAFATIDGETGEVKLTDPWADTQIHYEGDSWNDNGRNMYGCLNQLWKLKQRHRKLKILLSIGGWTYSQAGYFARGYNSIKKRENFAISAISLVKTLGLDGLDLDWEYPRSPEEAADYVDVLARCRRHLDSLGVGYELSSAAPCGPSNLDIKGMDQYLDFWNLMAYDFAGFGRTAGHQANIHPSRDSPASTPFSFDATLEIYSSIPSHKLVMGMPLYGRSFITEGPGHPFEPENNGSFENGVWDYKVLPPTGAVNYQDDEIVASWSYDPISRQMVSYDNTGIAKRKAEFILEKKLGGAMW
ncbi:Chitotriosidase-1 [Dactylellina cionopaga]|nr:Chitotriosidase-1 [Dactylellina cionopaga]